MTTLSSQAMALGQQAHQCLRARDYQAGWPLIERALALDPQNAILAHTKAHLSIDSGDFAAGAVYLRAFMATQDPFAGINVHNAWHLAYCEWELGEPAAALDWHRRVVAPTLCDQTFYSATNLLWQLSLASADRDSLRPDWEVMRRAGLALTRPRLLDDLGRALTFIASDDDDSLAHLLSRLQSTPDPPAAELLSRLQSTADAPAAELLPPLIQGLRAYWQGDDAGAIAHIEPLIPSLSRLSEFPDQLGIFHDTVRAARSRQNA